MMTIQDLRNNYKVEEIGGDCGDDELKFQIFAPFFANLYENKIVYYEKFFCLAIVQDITITPHKLHIKVAPYLKIEGPEFRLLKCPTQPWDFGSQWRGIGIVNNSFYVSYANWRVWPEPERVRAVELCLLREDFRGALDLTLRDPS